MRSASCSVQTLLQNSSPFLSVLISLIIIALAPQTCSADTKPLFEDMKGSVVTVHAYDHDGNEIRRTNGFIVRKDGIVAATSFGISNAAMVKIEVGEALFDITGLLHLDRKNDIAFIKAEGNNFPAIEISDTDPGPEGQKVYLLGNARREEMSLFDGTLSGIRQVSPERNLLIITAPDRKNCIGCPVVNENGNVIGIATIFLNEAQSFYFAAPLSRIREKLTITAVTTLETAGLKASEETAEHWFNLALAYESLGLFIEASGAYQKAIRIDPRDASAHNNLGVVYTNLGIYSFAIRELREAIQLDPSLQEAQVNIGMAYAKSDMLEEAADAFQKAISLRPDDAKAHNNLAVIYFQSGKYDESIRSFKNALQINPAYPNAYYNLGSLYYKLNRKRDAIDAYQEAVRLNPELAKARFELGAIYSVHDTKSAWEEYEILKNLDPDAALALQKIIEMKGNVSPEVLSSLLAAEKEKMNQSETAVHAAEEPSSPALPQSHTADHGTYPADASKGKRLPKDRAAEPQQTQLQAKPAKSGQMPQKDTYSVQVSVFSSRANAEPLLKRLQNKGYDAFLKTEYRVGQVSRYVVLVGKFADKDKAAEHSRLILTNENLKSIIVRQ